MFIASERITYLSKLAKEKPDLKLENLYKIICNPEFLLWSYAQIKNNKGTKTAGVDGVTKIDLESDESKLNEAIHELSNSLYTSTYEPLPVRRVKIPKGIGKSGTRPLGIPTIMDRIVQSATKIILEAIYEPIFLDTSHGFRPNRSCQTAINHFALNNWDWVIEGDIKGCFDNIKHGKLLNLLRKRIKDERFIQLINKFLKAGFQMGYGTDGKIPIFATKNGTPQGGIVSPVLANIYLHEFDVFMTNFEKNIKTNEYITNPNYSYWNLKVQRLSNSIKKDAYPIKQSIRKPCPEPQILKVGEAVWLENKQEALELLKKYKDARDSHFWADNYYEIRSLRYVRYADDFVILMGKYTKQETEDFKSSITEWFDNSLELVLSPEKTKISHATDGFKIVGYDIKHRVKQNGHKYGWNDKFVKIYVPRSAKERYITKVDLTLKTLHYSEPIDVINALNRITSGWSNFYKICHNWNSVKSKLDTEVFWKIAHALARKYKSSIPKILDKYSRRKVMNGRLAKRFVFRREGKEYKWKMCSDYGYQNTIEVASQIKNGKANDIWLSCPIDEDDERTQRAILATGRRSLLDMIDLVAVEGEKCWGCGDENVKFEIHHTRMVKRNKRKNLIALREAEKNNPKALLCTECHSKITTKQAKHRKVRTG